jgi:predicted transcriptional regulator
VSPDGDLLDRRAASADDGVDGRTWTFLTNHAHVLIAISRDPELRQRDISDLVGITEGAVQRILHELEIDGYVARERFGRRNRYSVIGDQPLRHRLEAGHTIEEIIETVNRSSSANVRR